MIDEEPIRRRPVWMRVGPAVAAAAVLTACGGPTTTARSSALPPRSPAATASDYSPARMPTVTPSPAAPTAASTPGPVVVRYRIERHTRDAATADFASILQ